MTKLESANIIIRNNGDCMEPIEIECRDCCIGRKNDSNDEHCLSSENCKRLEFAIKYLKEYENEI